MQGMKKEGKGLSYSGEWKYLKINFATKFYGKY
jgi:hypothetical protein